MLLAELEHSLKALGEKLSEDELAELFADCMDPEDEDGNIPYARKCRTFYNILQINKCPSTSIKFDLLLTPKIHFSKIFTVRYINRNSVSSESRLLTIEFQKD